MHPVGQKSKNNYPKFQKTPIKSKIINIFKKKLHFLLIELGTYIPNISFLGHKLWPIGREKTDRHTEKQKMRTTFFYKDLNLLLEKRDFFEKYFYGKKAVQYIGYNSKGNVDLSIYVID